MYRVDLSDRHVQRQLMRLPRNLRTRLQNAMLRLEQNPRPPNAKPLRGNLMGVWRLRIGGYRILYEIDDANRVVLIIDVGPRGSIYGP